VTCYKSLKGKEQLPYQKTAIRPVEILLVEDSPSDAELTQEALSDGKVLNNLHHVEDGVEALAFLYRQGTYSSVPRPDLILLDLNLPKKDGYEVLEQIKQDPSLKRIPVIILTTSSAEDDILKTYELNGNCYITKPMNLDQFICVIKLIEVFWLDVVKLPSER
jgi:two-component system, chemotaxis family, response regulator Rcp1